MDRMKTARNVAIVVAIAAAVQFVPGGGRAASSFEAALGVAFALGFGYLGLRFYREHRITIHSLGDRHRALLYAGLGVVLFAWAARVRMWGTGAGEFAWFVLVGFAVYALVAVYRRWRSY
jgi:hypothetical protein